MPMDLFANSRLLGREMQPIGIPLLIQLFRDHSLNSSGSCQVSSCEEASLRWFIRRQLIRDIVCQEKLSKQHVRKGESTTPLARRCAVPNSSPYASFARMKYNQRTNWLPRSLWIYGAVFLIQLPLVRDCNCLISHEWRPCITLTIYCYISEMLRWTMVRLL